MVKCKLLIFMRAIQDERACGFGCRRLTANMITWLHAFACHKSLHALSAGNRNFRHAYIDEMVVRAIMIKPVSPSICCACICNGNVFALSKQTRHDDGT